MQVHYLEIVTPDVDAVCETYAELHDVGFGELDQNLGGARTAQLANGGMLGIRAPLRDTEGRNRFRVLAALSANIERLILVESPVSCT